VRRRRLVRRRAGRGAWRRADRGAYVAEVSPRVAAEIAALRAVLEPYAVECALPHFATSEGRAELVDAVNTLSERTAEGDRPGSIEAHLAVHG
jgi:DNA-binding GntR family transcriptional regulator